MTDDEVHRAIDSLEQGLLLDDPAFVRRVKRLYRTELATAIVVFVLLAVGVVLLTVGAATASLPLWLGGVAAFLASFAANALHDHLEQEGTG